MGSYATLLSVNHAKKSWTILVAALVALSCSRPAQRDQLVIATERAPITLDPRFDVDTHSENAVELLANGLLRVNAKLDLEPDLAESVETPNSKTYIFHLRKGVKFHDGTTLTPEDVVYTYRYLAAEENASPFRSAFKFMKSAEVSGVDSVKVTLTEPYAFFSVAARRPIVSEVVATRLKKEGMAKSLVGTGPFRLQAWDERRGLDLESFSEYFRGAPSVKRIRLKPVLDSNVRLLEILKGSVDVVQNTSDGFPPGALDRVADEPGIAVLHSPGTNVQYLNFSFRNPILKDLRVRRAIAHAIDRNAIIKAKLGGYAGLATGFLPPMHWAYEPNVATYEFNPAKARELLDQAGYRDPDGAGPKKRFSLVYKVSTNPQSVEIAEVIVSQLQEIGIGVELRSLEFGVFFDDVKQGNFDLHSMQWTSVLIPDHYHDVFHSRSAPPEGFNRNGYSNPALDRLLDEGRGTIDRSEQKRIYSDVQKMVAADLPAFALWNPEHIALVRKRVSGFSISPRGTYDSLAATLISR